MSDHPFAKLHATPDELATGGALSADRLAQIVESIRDHGAAIVEGASMSTIAMRCATAMAEDLDAAQRYPFALDVPGHLQHNPPPRARDLYPDIIANPLRSRSRAH